jgi:hypothetical protein
MSTQFPMNFVFTAEVMSYVHFGVSACPAPIGGWWHTCDGGVERRQGWS